MLLPYSTCGCLRFSQVATSHHQRGKWRKPHFRVVNVIPINSIVCRQCPEVGLSKGKQSNSHDRHSYGKKGRNIWEIGSVGSFWNYCSDSFSWWFWLSIIYCFFKLNTYVPSSNWLRKSIHWRISNEIEWRMFSPLLFSYSILHY